MSEDAFDEFCDDISTRDWKQLEKSNYTVGYAEGKERGREVSQQSGFELGYKTCSTHIDRLLRIKGLLQRVVLASLQGTEKDASKIKSVIEKINTEQKRIIESLCSNECECSDASGLANKTPESGDCQLTRDCNQFLSQLLLELNAALEETGHISLSKIVCEMAEMKRN